MKGSGGHKFMTWEMGMKLLCAMREHILVASDEAIKKYRIGELG